METYKAFVVRESEEGLFSGKIEELCKIEPIDNEVVIKVEYSGLNYKDALSASGNKGITKKYPHVPGIDATGTIEKSLTRRFKKGDKVVVMGYDMGMNTDGGFAEYIKVPSDWVMHLPDSFTSEETMMIGTAGFTAALGVYKLIENGQTPDLGPIVISGATGGVGSFAIQMLSALGFEIWASTGKKEDNYLKMLGANKIIGREDIIDKTGKPLLRSQWAGAFDTVGGQTLATLVKGCNKLGSVVTCGSVTGSTLDLTIYPFILNGINLLGINSADTLMKTRIKIWQMLSGKMRPKYLKDMSHVIELEQVGEYIEKMLKGSNTGRVIIKV